MSTTNARRLPQLPAVLTYPLPPMSIQAHRDAMADARQRVQDARTARLAGRRADAAHALTMAAAFAFLAYNAHDRRPAHQWGHA